MNIVICTSIDFSDRVKEVADFLIKKGHKVDLPFYTKKIIAGEVSLEDYLKVKDAKGDISFREKAGEDLIKRYFRLIEKTDVILVLNHSKKGIKNYIGGNTFLEMGFAYVLNKKIFLLNPIPDISYRDEIEAMRPIILKGNLRKIT